MYNLEMPTKVTRRAKRTMRGGMHLSPADLTDVTMKTASAASMKQGGDFFGYHKAQHGGMAPVGYTGVLDDALRASARISPIDMSIGEIRGMKDQAGGRRRKTNVRVGGGFKLPMKMPAGLPAMPKGLPAMPKGLPALPAGLPPMPALPAGLPPMPVLPMMPQANANAAATNAVVANAVANVAVANAAVANANAAAAANGAAYANNSFGGRRRKTRARRGNRRDRKTRRMMYGGGALGFMDVKAPGMLLDGALAKQALNTMNAEWKLAEHASSFAPKQL
jgi:hypothetical protein